WFGSADGRANLAGAALVIGALWALRRGGRGRPLPGCAAAGALLAAACLLHESHLLFVPVALLGAALLPGSFARRLLHVAVLGAVWAAGVAIPYAVVVFG